MSDQIYWLVELLLRPGARDAFMHLTDEMTRAALLEPGTLVYERAVNRDESVVIGYERYADSKAATAHLAAFRIHFKERFDPLVERRQVIVVGHPEAELRIALEAIGARFAYPCAGFARRAFEPGLPT
jgi:quinol monooxygenase YgiN